jgi:hypothetical protein
MGDKIRLIGEVNQIRFDGATILESYQRNYFQKQDAIPMVGYFGVGATDL